MSFTSVLIVLSQRSKFQVEFRFCKTIGCSHVCLLTTYLVKKKLFKVSNRNTWKRCPLISKVTLKNRTMSLDDQLFPGGDCSEPYLGQFVMPICNQKSACSSAFKLTSRNFNNSRLIYVILREMRNNYRTIWFMKNSKCQHFLFLKKQPQKWTNFSTFYLQRAAISQN